jgi:hypothetical protein
MSRLSRLYPEPVEFERADANLSCKMPESHPPFCVVGIDFGTSGTGFAFSFQRIDNKGYFHVI